MINLSNSPTYLALEHKVALYVDQANAWLISHQLIVLVQLAVFSICFFLFLDNQPPRKRAAPRPQLPAPQLNSLPKMEAPNVVLNAPLDTPYTVAELATYNGQDPSRPIYVAMKGIIFDVSAKREMYGPNAGYNVFAGKDGSRGLGKSSLKPEDAVADWSTLDDSEKGVLEDWVKYFTKRYNIVGKVVA